ncbi:MAG: MiaB/RimO family radical SAM methylthiotransferase, partial [Pseudomonas sp.]|nr:MiaB/RimO family radical SAM methylthiotransferase [Pseudomonas sp.]
GCDRRCAFCAIPAFRGSYISRPVEEVIEEAEWLVQEGVKEVMLVSENTSSYGKDLGDRRGLIKLLRELNDVPGLERVRVSYLQPAEIYPGLLETMASLEHVMSYFDISFQHASASVLRRMRRFGDEENFLKLLETVRQLDPQSGARSNFIVGFPGETEEEFETLCDFVQEARLDVMGVFAYSDEEGTEGEKLEGHLPDDVIADRTRILTDLVTQMMDQRAAERVGEEVSVLIESLDENSVVGRAEHQGPEVDGETRIEDADPQELRVGDIVKAKVVDSFGADLVAKQG